MSISDDLHHIRIATEASVVEQKATNALLTAIAADVGEFKTVLVAIEASLKKLTDELGVPVVGIQADFEPPKTRP